MEGKDRGMRQKERGLGRGEGRETKEETKMKGK